jgi:hypothetical protein
MPLLTAAIIVCGAMHGPGQPLACRAQVFHGIHSEQPICAVRAEKTAKSLQEKFILDGKLTRTRSHGECFYAEDEGSIVFYLPEFMRIEMGAKSVSVVHYDIVGDEAIERAPVVPQAPKIKGARI